MTQKIMTEFLSNFFSEEVCREKISMLEAYVSLLHKWHLKINIISKNDMKVIWARHILDSAQLLRYIEVPKTEAPKLVDIGSGGGFPGIVLGILYEFPVLLVESDMRKSAFLRNVAAKLELRNVEIYAGRIEALSEKGKMADIITARALADLPVLLGYALPILRDNGRCFFLKGAQYEAEVARAEVVFRFVQKVHASITSEKSRILELSDLKFR